MTLPAARAAPAIVLTTLNAKYIHASLGLRYLLANMGELQPRTVLREFTIACSAREVADAVVFLARPELPWDADKVIAAIRGEARAVAGADALIARLREAVRAGDHVVFMSNGGFDGAPRRFLAALRDA